MNAERLRAVQGTVAGLKPKTRAAIDTSSRSVEQLRNNGRLPEVEVLDMEILLGETGCGTAGCIEVAPISWTG